LYALKTGKQPRAIAGLAGFVYVYLASDSLDHCVIQIRLIQDVNARVTFEAQPRNRPLEPRGVQGDHVFIHEALGAREIPLQALFQRDVERDGHRLDAVIVRNTQQAAARPRLEVCGVDHRQPPRREPDARDVMQKAERRPVEALITFVVANHCATAVGGDDLCLLEVASREGRFARA
jgi:hypothetical protein